MDQKMSNCIQNCSDCNLICLETVTYCLQKGGVHSDPEHIRLLLDCASICSTSAAFMTRGSLFHTETCRICAEICEDCAESCEKTDANDPVMKRCVEICKRCAESCHEMAGAHA